MAWTYKQIWDNATNYTANDVVLYNYLYYRALAANTNSQPSLTNSNWIVLDTASILTEIISQGLNLDPSRIFIYNQDFNLPTDNGLFVVIQLIGAEDSSATNQMIEEEDVSIENLTTLTLEYYTINVCSRDRSARFRYREVINALSNINALYWQDVFQIKIARNSSQITNLSDLEGGSMLTRIGVDFKVNSWFAQTNNITYYDQFPNSLLTN